MGEHFETTPSGIEIVYEDGLPSPETGTKHRRSYTVNGEEAVSVTTCLGCLEKPGLAYAAEKIALQGAIDLATDGGLPTDVEGTLAALKDKQARFYQLWRAKGDRGTETHDDLARAVAGEVDPLEVSEAAMPFVGGVREWLAQEGPETIQSEVMVASAEYGVAGRFDWLGRLPNFHTEARVRLDLKTVDEIPRYANGKAKLPYPENLAQLAGYEICARESGYEPSEFQAVLRVDKTGAHDLFITVVDPSLFLSILGAYRALRGLKTLEAVKQAA